MLSYNEIVTTAIHDKMRKPMNNVERLNNLKKLNYSLRKFISTVGNGENGYLERWVYSWYLFNRDYQVLHHEICKFMFDCAEKGEELWIKIVEQEDIVTRENTENNYKSDEVKPYYRLSVMTQTMLDYDHMMFNLISEENREEFTVENRYATNMYRPYFYSFLVDAAEFTEDSTGFFTNPENKNQWFIGRFANSETENEGRIYSGYIERIASPAKYKDYKIEISDKRLSPAKIKEINEIYDLGSNPCSSDKDIENELVHILESPQFREARIYNVGNGNCIYLKGHNRFGKLRILYDIGYYCKIPSMKINKTTYQPSVQAIRNLKPHCIILSHWDSDHFYGCAFAGYDIFRCKWFAPNLDADEEISAKRVAKYLQLLKNLFLVDRTRATNHMPIASIKGIRSELKLFMGEIVYGKDIKITDCNKEGIVLELVNDGANATVHSFMAGDVPYESLPSAVNFSGNTPYDYLIVPHHGAEMDTSRLLPTSRLTESGYAIICAKSHRPNEKHMCKLQKNGYIIQITGNAGFCIDINLLQKQSPKMRP